MSERRITQEGQSSSLLDQARRIALTHAKKELRSVQGKAWRAKHHLAGEHTRLYASRWVTEEQAKVAAIEEIIARNIVRHSVGEGEFQLVGRGFQLDHEKDPRDRYGGTYSLTIDGQALSFEAAYAKWLQLIGPLGSISSIEAQLTEKQKRGSMVGRLIRRVLPTRA